MRKKKNVVSNEIEQFINDMLSQVKNDTEASLTDKMKVLDRALKWEAIKLKAEDDAWGSGFMQEPDDDS
jgi:hypothetical protein